MVSSRMMIGSSIRWTFTSMRRNPLTAVFFRSMKSKPRVFHAFHETQKCDGASILGAHAYARMMIFRCFRFSCLRLDIRVCLLMLGFIAGTWTRQPYTRTTILRRFNRNQPIQLMSSRLSNFLLSSCPYFQMNIIKNVAFAIAGCRKLDKIDVFSSRFNRVFASYRSPGRCYVIFCSKLHL